MWPNQYLKSQLQAPLLIMQENEWSYRLALSKPVAPSAKD